MIYLICLIVFLKVIVKKAYEVLEKVVANMITDLVIEGLEKGTIAIDELNEATETAEKVDTYLEVLNSFTNLSEEYKKSEIRKKLREILKLLYLLNKNYDENNEMFPLLEEADDNHFFDAMFSYVLTVQDELTKFIEHLDILEIEK